MKHIIKHMPSLFWNFLEQASFTGISRLVLFPLVAHLVGKNDFGLFATALSFSLIVGKQPANGLSIGLLRNLAHYQGHQQIQLTFTAIRMCHKFLLYFLLSVLVVLVGIVFFELIDFKTYLCLTFLAISLYAENEFMLILSPLRYKRLFREHSLWYIASSLCILLLGFLGTYLAGIVGLVFGMMLSNFIMYGFAVRHYYETGLTYDSELAKSLRWIWVHITIAGVLVAAGPHLNRIILRFYADNESVADLFAATGIAFVFILPISNSGSLLLSMLSKYKKLDEISASVYKLLFGLMFGGMAIAMTLFALTAPLMLRFLFPGFGDRALNLFPVLIWMIPANIIVVILRPFITKFARVAWIPRINSFVLATTIILIVILIPRWGLEGAAWSITIGNIIAAILRVVVFCFIFKEEKTKTEPGERVNSANNH